MKPMMPQKGLMSNINTAHAYEIGLYESPYMYQRVKLIKYKQEIIKTV